MTRAPRQGGKRPSTSSRPTTVVGKRVQFDLETWQSLDLMARDRMMTFQELADEAFRDVLTKHGRPADLRDALKRSARAVPANDTAAAKVAAPADARPSKPSVRKRPASKRKRPAGSRRARS